MCWVQLFWAQGAAPLTMQFQLYDQAQPLPPRTWVALPEGARARIDVCKIYLSGFAYADAQGEQLLTQPQAVLVDFFTPETTQLQLPIPPANCQHLILTQGITPALNDAGIGEGPLDPAKGMYWTWETGYIHCKIEGQWQQHGRTTPFTLHLGGFLPPLQSAQRMEWPLPSSNGVWHTTLDLHPLLLALLHQPKRDLMSPSAAAVALSQTLAQCWRVR